MACADASTEILAAVTNLRYVYLTTCKQEGVSPCVSFLNQVRDCIDKKVLLHRISITHGSFGDAQIVPVTAILSCCPDITDIALNYVVLTNKGCTHLLRFLASLPQGPSSLELFGNKIGDESCRYIPPLLNLQTLTRLKLGDNKLNAAGAALVATGLRNQKSLIQLHLGGNNIGDEGLIAIVDALKTNSTLTSLGIRDNGIGYAGVNGLVELLCRKDCVLSEVQLKGNNIGDEGAEALARAMYLNTTMRVLEVQSNNVGPRGAAVLCNALHNNTTVHAINFNDNRLFDEGAEAVAALLMHNISITTVGLSGNNIEKRGTAAISKALACNSSLTGLDLGNNKLGNSGIITLSNVLKDQNSTLMSLDVHLNSMNLQGVLALTQALLSNTSLRHLDAGSNYSRNQGAHAWAKVIRKSTVLSRLCLTDNEIGREGGDSLLAAVRFNTTLRNFQFGGQSQVHPLANRIAPVTRRAINNIVSRNKTMWERVQVSPRSDGWLPKKDFLPPKAGTHGDGEDKCSSSDGSATPGHASSDSNIATPDRCVIPEYNAREHWEPTQKTTKAPKATNKAAAKANKKAFFDAAPQQPQQPMDNWNYVMPAAIQPAQPGAWAPNQGYAMPAVTPINAPTAPGQVAWGVSQNIVNGVPSLTAFPVFAAPMAPAAGWNGHNGLAPAQSPPLSPPEMFMRPMFPVNGAQVQNAYHQGPLNNASFGLETHMQQYYPTQEPFMTSTARVEPMEDAHSSSASSSDSGPSSSQQPPQAPVEEPTLPPRQGSRADSFPNIYDIPADFFEKPRNTYPDFPEIPEDFFHRPKKENPALRRVRGLTLNIPSSCNGDNSPPPCASPGTMENNALNTVMSTLAAMGLESPVHRSPARRSRLQSTTA